MQKKRSPAEAIESAQQLKVRYLQLRHPFWTEDDWLRLKDTNLLFTIFYGDTEEEFEWMVKKRPYGIFSNHPDRLRNYISSN